MWRNASRKLNGMHQHLHRAPAEAGGHLPAQQLGRGAGHEHLHAARVDQTANQLAPSPERSASSSRYRVTPPSPFRSGNRRACSSSSQPRSATVSPASRSSSSRSSSCDSGRAPACRRALRHWCEKRGLAAAAYPDHRERLAGDRRKPHVPGRKDAGRKVPPAPRQASREGTLGILSLCK